MIKLKLKVFGESDTAFSTNPGETIKSAIYRMSEHIPLGGHYPEEVFIVLHNGLAVSSENWEWAVLQEGDVLIVAPRIEGDNEASAARQIFVVVATALAAVYLSPVVVAKYGAVAGALSVAGVSMAAALAANALIPPPVPSEVLGANPLAASQMYSISGQSNNVNRFGPVPRVYGTHRMFPLIAANPYTELEYDPATGELSTYLYAIYDFGHGPSRIADIRIGETPIGYFDQVEHRLVDLNRPATSTGPWDDELQTSFIYYKGDVSVEPLAISLNKNSSTPGVPQSEYQATRLCAENPDLVSQEVTLSFVNPEGLFALDNSGNRFSRRIELGIYFRRVGQPTWLAYNDPSHVNSFSSLGGDQATSDIPLELFPPTFPANSGLNPPAGTYSKLSTSMPYSLGGAWSAPSIEGIWVPYTYTTMTLGYAAGATQLLLKNDSSLIPGRMVYFNGTLVGTVASVDTYPSNTAYSQVTLTQPLASAISLFTAQVPWHTQPWPFLVPTGLPVRPINVAVTGRSFIRIPIIGKAFIQRSDTSAAYSTFKFTPKVAGQYQVRVTRVTTTSSVTNQVRDVLTWIGLRSRFDRAPIVTDKRHTFLEVKIRATNQLNGAIQNLSALVTSVLDVWNGSAWVKQETSNPAWVFADILTGPLNKKPLAKSRLDIPSIAEWAEFCEAVPDSPPSRNYTFPRFMANYVLDYSGTVQSAISQVCSAAQASLSIIDGKYGVLLDKKRTTPVQVFTPRNSSGFASSRVYTKQPHALRVKFIDPDNSWQVNEVVVYAAGYDQLTATEIDDITSFACTNSEQAYRFGKFMMAQNALRQETISLQVDFEYLVAKRGDFVKITQDVMKVGGIPARVTSVSGNRVTIDDGITTEVGKSYGFTFRSKHGAIVTNTLTVVDSSTFDLAGSSFPEVGDLFIFGEVGSITYDCIVKTITPEDEFRATLTLVEKADGVYDAESEDSAFTYDPRLSQSTSPSTTPPGEVTDLEVLANGWRCLGGGYQYYVDIDWDLPLGSAFERFQIFVNDGRGFTEYGSTRNTTERVIINPARLNIEHEFKVIAVSASGAKLDVASVTGVRATPLRKVSPPSNLDFLETNITNEVLQVSWPEPSDCDISSYLIRYSPDLNAVWESSTPLARASRGVNSVSVQARTGVYLAKAVDWNGNESADVARAITTIPELSGLNFIETINDFPSLNGVFDRTEKLGDEIILAKKTVGAPGVAEFHEEGFYYYEDLLDLGDIYTVRLQSNVQAEGYADLDLMANWVSLDAVPALARAKSPDWDVIVEYRSTNQISVMADWDLLSNIDPIGGGTSEQWTPWRPFIMGDVTGRIFQFRLRLISNLPSISPRVFSGVIRADMADRQDIYNNLLIPEDTPEGGLQVNYDPPFAGPVGGGPNLQISIDGAQFGDYYLFENRTTEGVLVKIFDKDDNPVSRQFDLAARGYGKKNNSVI